MVLKKRLEYGFNGYQIPIVPKAPRSVRRRCPRKNAVGDHQICAFELLAAVAGKLLQENESSTSSNAYGAKDLLGIRTECLKEEFPRVEQDHKASRSECLDQGSCVESVFIPELAAKPHGQKPILDDIPTTKNSSFLEHISNVTSSDSSKKVDCELKLGVCNSKAAEGNLHTKVGGSFPLIDPCDGKVESETLIQHSKDLTVDNTFSVKKQVEKCVYSNQLINSDSSVKLSLYRDPLPSASFLRHRNDLNLGIRDDEKNSFRCKKFNTKIRAFRPQPRNCYGRFRKTMTSKYWKGAPKFRDHGLPNTNEGTRPLYHSRKRIHLQDRYLQEVPFKKRMLYDRSFVVDNDHEASSESISNSPEGIKGDKYGAAVILHRGNGVSTSVKAHTKKKDSKVKFSIKSFKVPELYIEVPETETIGSLKRTVMETVTAILGGGLRVGVVLQGKKVRDDNRTLQQAGIYSSNLDTLGFILEPSFTPVAEASKDPDHLFKSVEEQNSLRRPANTLLDSGLPDARFHRPIVTKMDNNHDIIPLSVAHADPSTDEATLDDSKALVPVPVPNAEPLSMVPMNQKNKRSEISQRRTRRPFSVAEVEALVEAVEVLGAGRWRDVKMRAFENADHRTYVDLKDKWKTLVHTASISSQQRRGEPVPQELLDRVLCAHSYWSKHQNKQHVKHNAEPLKAIEARGEPLEV